MRTQPEHWKHSVVTHRGALSRYLHRQPGWKVTGWLSGGCSLLRLTHAHSSHGCCWGWQTSLNGCYWGESSRSIARPQSTRPSPGDGCWVVGDKGRVGVGIWKCVHGWPRASPPFSLPSPLLIILSVNLCSRPGTTLTLTPFSFRLGAVCRCTVLITRVRAPSAVSCACNV